MDDMIRPETPTEAIEHVRFQTDLLKLCSMSIELTGPSVMQELETQSEAVRVVSELETTVARLQHSR